MSREQQGIYDRPPSEQLVDIHIYLVAPELWRDQSRSAVSQVIEEAASIGFIRVLPELSLYAIREELEVQLGDDFPRDFVFLRSVGRHLARVRPKQEFQLRVKSFLPPQTYAPELFLVETTPEMRASFPFSEASSERSDSRVRERLEPMHTGETTKSDTSVFNDRKPIPPIRQQTSTVSLATQTGEDDRSPRKGYPYPPPADTDTRVAPSYDVPTEHNLQPPYHPSPRVEPHATGVVNAPPLRGSYAQMASQTSNNVNYQPQLQMEPNTLATLRTAPTNNTFSTQTENPSVLREPPNYQLAPTENFRYVPEESRHLQPVTSENRPQLQNGSVHNSQGGNVGQGQSGWQGYGYQQQTEGDPPWQGHMGANDRTQWQTPRDDNGQPSSQNQMSNLPVRSNTFPSKMDRASQTVLPGQSELQDFDPTNQNGFPVNQSYVAQLPDDHAASLSGSHPADVRNPNQFPLTDPRNPNQFPPSDPRNPNQFPPSDPRNSNQFPLADPSNPNQFPSADPRNPNQFPSTDPRNPNQFPSSDPRNPNQFPSSDPRNPNQFPSADPRNPNQFPAADPRNPVQFHHTDLRQSDPRFPAPHQAQPQQYPGNPTGGYPVGVVPPTHSHGPSHLPGQSVDGQGVKYSQPMDTGQYEHTESPPKHPPVSAELPPASRSPGSDFTKPLDTNMVSSDPNRPPTQPGRYTIEVSEDSGISDGMMESERRNQEYLRKQQGDRELLSQGRQWDEGELPLEETMSRSGGKQQEGDVWRQNGSGRIPPGSAELGETQFGHGPSTQQGVREETWRQRDELPVRDTDNLYGNGDVTPHSQDVIPHSQDVIPHSQDVIPHSEDGVQRHSSRPTPELDRLDGQSDRKEDEGRRSQRGQPQGQGSPFRDDTVRQDEDRTQPGVSLRWQDDSKETHDDRSNQDRSNQGSRLDSQQRAPTAQSLPAAEDNQKEKEKLLEDLERVRTEKAEIQRRREELVKRAKVLQEKSKDIRNHARDVWKKNYFDEKKKTSPLEDETQKMQQELEMLHKRIVSSLEVTKDPGRKRDMRPSQKSSLQIQATKLQHQTEDLRGRIEKVKLRLSSEMKLRSQAETELRVMKAELTQKKIHVTLSRMQQGHTLNSSSTALAMPPY